jgi:simple sugar transport system permease protein
MSLETVLRSIFSAFFLASVIRICTPIILPSMGGLFATAAGTFNMALEGIMLWGAFTGVFVSAYTGNVWIAVLCGVIAGILASMILAVFHLEFGVDLVLGGLAVNLFSSGGTIFLMYTLIGEKGNTSTLPSLSVPNVHIPLLKDIPVLGQILSGHPVFTYIAILAIIVAYIVMYRTRFGTHVRAVGQNTEAAITLGINVKKIRYLAIGISGALAALGGMSLSMAYLQMFQRDMSAGRGWIALAAVNLGNRHPLGVAAAAVVFGLADALANQFGSLKVPSQLVQIIPYATTIVALVVYAVQQKRSAITRMKKYQQAHFEEIKTHEGISE